MEIAKCTPSWAKRTPSLWWCKSTESILWPNNTGKSLFYVEDLVGGEIAEARNCIVQTILNYEQAGHKISHLFWLDDDVIIPRGGALLQLLHHDRDIASGVYFTKLPGNQASPLIYPGPHGGTDIFKPNRTYEVWGHGMGLTLIKLDVYKRMRDELKLPYDKYNCPEWYKTSKNNDDMVVENDVVKTGFTEDLFFLDNASKLGYKPLVDTNKHAFGFHYDHETRKGYPEEQWNDWLQGKPITWHTSEGDVIWD